MSRFKDKTFLITGGARGLGAAQARRVVAEGGQVLIADVLQDLGQALASELGPRCVFQPLDVTQPQGWQQAVQAAERLGPLISSSRSGVAAGRPSTTSVSRRGPA